MKFLFNICLIKIEVKIKCFIKYILYLFLLKKSWINSDIYIKLFDSFNNEFHIIHLLKLNRWNTYR